MSCCCADLHIHTVLSPCAFDEMTPAAVVKRPRSMGLAMIAVCDHNKAGCVEAVQGAACELPAVSVVASSDAHCLDEIGRRKTLFDMREPTFEELALAFQGGRGRRCAVA